MQVGTGFRPWPPSCQRTWKISPNFFHPRLTLLRSALQMWSTSAEVLSCFLKHVYLLDGEVANRQRAAQRSVYQDAPMVQARHCVLLVAESKFASQRYFRAT